VNFQGVHPVHANLPPGPSLAVSKLIRTIKGNAKVNGAGGAQPERVISRAQVQLGLKQGWPGRAIANRRFDFDPKVRTVNSTGDRLAGGKISSGAGREELAFLPVGRMARLVIVLRELGSLSTLAHSACEISEPVGGQIYAERRRRTARSRKDTDGCRAA
jgi:hypothetical protein